MGETPFLQVKEFFGTARERYRIKLRREAGEPWPWTTDKILQEWRFTNVHREDDKTTVWFRENVRNPVSRTGHHLKILEATLIFRWFNRIETGKRILDLLVGEWDTQEARRRLKNVSPIVTGAYIIKAGDGLSKLDGILASIDAALPYLPRYVQNWHHWEQDDSLTLEGAWTNLKMLYFMGGFMAYEVVTDLRHTPLLQSASDILTWANFGPGGMRGMGRVMANDPHLFVNSAKGQREMLELARRLLEMSQQEEYWPQDWPIWEMHEVEMWTCEYAKYCNAKEGQRLKRRYVR